MLQRQFDEFETIACFAPIKARTSGASLNPSHSQKCSALVAPARKTALSSSNMLVRPIGKIFRQMSNSPWKPPRVHVSAIVRGVGRVP